MGARAYAEPAAREDLPWQAVERTLDARASGRGPVHLITPQPEMPSLAVAPPIAADEDAPAASGVQTIIPPAMLASSSEPPPPESTFRTYTLAELDRRAEAKRASMASFIDPSDPSRWRKILKRRAPMIAGTVVTVLVTVVAAAWSSDESVRAPRVARTEVVVAAAVATAPAAPASPQANAAPVVTAPAAPPAAKARPAFKKKKSAEVFKP